MLFLKFAPIAFSGKCFVITLTWQNHGKGKGKGIVYPRTGHEGPEG
jgi:hypothetical protein